MSESILNQAADRRGPLRRSAAGSGAFTPHIIAISEDGTTHNRDLTSASFFNSSQYMDRYVSMSCEAAGAPIAFFWYWSDSAADTIDKTATGNGITVGAYCPSGLVNDERPTGQYLVVQTASAANLHIWFSSGKF